MSQMKGNMIKPPEVEAGKFKNSLRMTSGFSQILILLLGIFISLSVYFTLNYFTLQVRMEEYRRVSQESGGYFLRAADEMQHTVNAIVATFSLFSNNNADIAISHIRKNISNLTNFDKVIFLYESTPGNWHFNTVYTKLNNSVSDNHTDFVPDQAMISKIVKDRYFYNDKIQVSYDLPNLAIWEKDSQNSKLNSNSFALIKAVEKNSPRKGMVIAITNFGFLLDDNFYINRPVLRKVDVKNLLEDESIYSFSKDLKLLYNPYIQSFDFDLGGQNWNITFSIKSEKSLDLLDLAPLISALIFMALTLMVTFFVRHKHKQSLLQLRMYEQIEKNNAKLVLEVDERERLNAILARAEKEYKSIIDSVSDVILETDTEGNIMFLSAAWRRITGFESERSIGSLLFSMMHFDEQERLKADFDLLVSGQKHSYRSFARLRVSDGTFRSVELSLSMLRQDENKKMRVVGAITDVEERRRAERALAEAEKKYRTIVENAAGGIFQITPEGMFLSVNPAMARILGYNSVEELLRLVKNAFSSVFIDPVQRNIFLEDLNRKGQIFGHETQILTKDKTKIWVKENIRVVRDDLNNILYYEGSMEDITTQKISEIELREAKLQSDMASRAKTEFIANMSHELRTPLNAIIGFSEIIKDQVMGEVGQPIYIDYASDIHKSGKNLLNIINEILDISKIESGDRELKESEINLFDVVSNLKEVLSAKLLMKKISLVDKTDKMPSLVAEESSIRQVVRNIISNAIQYTNEGGIITLLSNYDHDGSFRLTISDTGIGMSTLEIQKALSPFGQIDNDLSRSGSGTGMGLPLAQALMKLHGGEIEVISQKGIGTTVGIIFPAKRIIKDEATVIHNNILS